MGNILKYIFKRILATIPILFGTILIAFMLGRMMRGNPFILSIGRPTAYNIARYEENIKIHGIDQPIWIQFQYYLRNIMTGDWGKSWAVARGKDVWSLIIYMAPSTFELMFISFLVSIIVALNLGVFLVKRKKKTSKWIQLLISGGASIPITVISYLFIYVMFRLGLWQYSTGYKTRDFPDPIRYTGLRLLDCLISGEFNLLLDSIIHYIAPVAVLSFPLILIISRQVRSSLLDSLSNDYIRTARAKGCSENQVIRRHALKNAMIPTVTIIGMSVPLFISNVVLVEIIFRLPGFASLFIASVRNMDYNVTLACISVFVIVVVFGNLFVDILYAFIDPRIVY